MNSDTISIIFFDFMFIFVMITIVRGMIRVNIDTGAPRLRHVWIAGALLLFILISSLFGIFQ